MSLQITIKTEEVEMHEEPQVLPENIIIKTEEVHISSELPVEESPPADATGFQKCYLCNPVRLLETGAHLERHLNECHDQQECYHCVKCETAVYRIASFNQHLALHYQESQKSDDTPKRSSTRLKTSLRNKRKPIYSEDDAPIEKISKVCNKKDETRRSMSESQKEKTSDGQSKEPSEPNQPMVWIPTPPPKEIEPTPTVPCSVCDKKFSNKLKVQKHEFYVHKVSHLKWDCFLCGEHFASLHKQKAHDEHSHNQKCHLCRGQPLYPCRNTLLTHLKSAHHSASGKYNCKKCSYTTLLVWCYNRHYNRHDVSVRPFMCDVCGLRFASHVGLIDHGYYVHEVDLDFCKICNMTMKTEDLDRHFQKVHPSESYNCSICNSKFYSDNKLYSHQESVHKSEFEIPKERPTSILHKCYVCKPAKTFESNVLLRQHAIMTHITKSVYQCEWCDYSADQVQRFNLHVSKHSAQAQPSRSKCTECSMTFSDGAQEEHHALTVHKLWAGTHIEERFTKKI